MNKLLLDNYKLSLENEIYSLDKCGNFEIDIFKEVTIYDYNNTLSTSKYTFNLNENSVLNYYKFDKNNNNIDVIINCKGHSVINYYYNILCHNSSSLDIVCNIMGNDNINNIKINALTEKEGIIKIRANGRINEKTYNNQVNEIIKILKFNNKESVIEPFLCVSANDLYATHNATCSGIDYQELFYLMSKGISKTNAKKIIKKGFLNNNLKIDIDNYL